MHFYKIFKFIIVGISFCVIILFLNGCGSLPKIPKPDWSKPIEPNATIRAQQNVKDGKGINLFKRNQSGNSNFLFASSNPMWKASLEILSFIPIANSDYSGGVLITDWYSEKNPNEAVKVTIKFLSNEVRADGIIVNLYKRTCINNVCSVDEIKGNLVSDIKNKILRKAAIYENSDKKIARENQPKKKFRGENK
ncbi:DUF3576 domain-containing protein [Candidatus Pelagibacter sp.]|nr:DUF3576 domain-containing protein [Candidatus Pelagibacter sp.]